MDEKRLDEVGNRLLAVCEKRRLNRPTVGWVTREGGFQIRVGAEYFSPADLRALANAIDAEDDVTAAMIHDLKEDNAGYQSGLKQGARDERESIWQEAMRCQKEKRNRYYQAGVELRKEGESILVRAVETPAEHVRKERETMQLLRDLMGQLWDKGFYMTNEEVDAHSALINKARQAILEYERDRTERLSGPAGG